MCVLKCIERSERDRSNVEKEGRQTVAVAAPAAATAKELIEKESKRENERALNTKTHQIHALHTQVHVQNQSKNQQKQKKRRREKKTT